MLPRLRTGRVLFLWPRGLRRARVPRSVRRRAPARVHLYRTAAEQNETQQIHIVRRCAQSRPHPASGHPNSGRGKNTKRWLQWARMKAANLRGVRLTDMLLGDGRASSPHACMFWSWSSFHKRSGLSSSSAVFLSASWDWICSCILVIWKTTWLEKKVGERRASRWQSWGRNTRSVKSTERMAAGGVSDMDVRQRGGHKADAAVNGPLCFLLRGSLTSV